MNVMIDVGAGGRNAAHVGMNDEIVCWSRMQAEAGQALDAIIARKEIERQAGGGYFMWGVGNPPALIARSLARAHVPVRAVFSIMKSRPKAVDAQPSRTVVWRRYLDAEGVERTLPPYALVTSRGDSTRGAKRMHFALMCYSPEPLAIRRGEAFDPNAFRNAGGTGAPVGASQVTALLRRVDADAVVTDYEANISAWLTASYWVRLLDPVELDAGKQKTIASAAAFDAGRWCALVEQIRSGEACVEARTGALL
ncbi:hypothetical protein [Sphingomonas panni]|uniref:hypothetical protein n=1 Tax=Sphingomonas panni TaxID=237612 RepID=UPI001F5BD9DE|nr:hypothetical protein [Sphingomonas panni]